MARGTKRERVSEWVSEREKKRERGGDTWRDDKSYVTLKKDLDSFLVLWARRAFFVSPRPFAGVKVWRVKRKCEKEYTTDQKNDGLQEVL